MGGAAIGCGRVLIGRRAHQRVPEADRRGRDLDKVVGLRGLEVGEGDAEIGGGPCDPVQRLGSGRGDEQQRGAGRVRETLQPAPERRLDARTDGQGIRQRIAARELLAQQVRRRLQQRQRVSRGRAVQPGHDVRGHRPARCPAQQLGRVVPVESFDRELLHPGQVEVAALDRPQRHDQRDRLALQPPRDEQQRVGRRVVEPMRVVDHHQHRPVRGRRRQQPDHRRVHHQAIGRRRRPQGQRALQRPGLDRGQVAQTVEHRPQQREQRGEGQVGLGLRPRCSEDAHARVGAGGGVAQQCGFADSRLTDERERATSAVGRASDQRVQPRSFAGPTDQVRHLDADSMIGP